MAVPTDLELKALLDQFVNVRQVQMWGVDLERFQFDYSMTWAVFLMNGDGTIYGRYGSRSALARQSTREISLSGFKKALKGALAWHQRYQKDKATTARELAGKQTQHHQRWKRAEDIPALKARGHLASPFRELPGRHGSCIHCHMIPNHELLSLRELQLPIPDRKIWPYPMPDVVGFHMDPQEMALVEHVRPGSQAARAGLQKGDQILRFEGQPMLSTADLQWVLHQAGDAATLPLLVKRGTEILNLTLSLEKGWRQTIHEWRFINLGVVMRIAGFNGRPLPRSKARGLGLAIRVGRVNRRRLNLSDLRRGDIIVAMDRQTDPMTLGQFTSYLLRKKPPDSTLRIVRLRHGQRHSFTLLVN